MLCYNHDMASIDKKSVRAEIDRLQEILPTRRQPDNFLSKFILDFFHQTFVITPDIHTHISKQEKIFTRLSSGLVDVIGNLEMTPFRLRVKGAAGSGKSLVAAHIYQRAVPAYPVRCQNSEIGKKRLQSLS